MPGKILHRTPVTSLDRALAWLVTQVTGYFISSPHSCMLRAVLHRLML